jgi:hypothetical protein
MSETNLCNQDATRRKSVGETSAAGKVLIEIVDNFEKPSAS